VIVPGLAALFAGAAMAQVTPLLKPWVPVTVALNWMVVPMVAAAGLGVTVTD
jgi:hypothetical protein